MTTDLFLSHAPTPIVRAILASEAKSAMCTTTLVVKWTWTAWGRREQVGERAWIERDVKTNRQPCTGGIMTGLPKDTGRQVTQGLGTRKAGKLSRPYGLSWMEQLLQAVAMDIIPPTSQALPSQARKPAGLFNEPSMLVPMRPDLHLCAGAITSPSPHN